MKEIRNFVMMIIVVFLIGLFGFMAGSSADKAVNDKETVETKIVTEIGNVFTMTKSYLEDNRG